MLLPPLPDLWRYRRSLGLGLSLSLAAEIRREWERLGLSRRVAGKRIALGLGSRGITGLVEAAQTLVACIRQAGGEPFVVPAMGSHGGATGEGQRDMLAGLGLTPESLNCPVISSMEVVDFGPSPEGHALYCDAQAARADGILLFNRIKAHTSFSGPVESGIQKMLAIGLGKERAATWLHAHGPSGLADKMPQVARALLSRLPFIAGFAVLEDAAHQPARLEAMTAENLSRRETELLAYAKSLSPRLPAQSLDLLVVDQVGKNISGTGMDTHVIGRLRIAGEAEPTAPKIAAITALRLTEATHGNALGIGLADFTTARLAAQVDFAATSRNVAATGNLERGRLPLVFPSDQEAISAALRHVFRRQPDAVANARILRIANTLELGEGWCSSAVLQEIRELPGMVISESAQPWGFSDLGDLAIPA